METLERFLSSYALDDLFALEGGRKEYFHIRDDKANVANLIKIHHNSKLLFPSYLLRMGAFHSIGETSDKVLSVLLDAGSMLAYNELKKRANDNYKMLPDEFLVIGAQNNGFAEREILLERYQPFIEKIVRKIDSKYYFKGYEYEDLLQEAFIGFLKAIEVFKIERRTKFKKFSNHVIQRHLGTIMNRSKNNRNRTLNDSFSYNMKVTHTGGNTTFEELLAGAQATPEKIVEDMKTYEEIFERLTENEQKVLLYYEKGYSYEEIAFKLITQKKTIDFEGMDYEEVASSIRKYEIYKNTEEELRKKLIASLYKPVVQFLRKSGEIAPPPQQEPLGFLVENVIQSQGLKNPARAAASLKEAIIGFLESEAFDWNNANNDSSLEQARITKKSFVGYVYEHSADDLRFEEGKIAEKVLKLNFPMFKHETKTSLVEDIREKLFGLATSKGLSWEYIANEMKRKRKSVDNTIQRIRNKGLQYIQECIYSY